MASVTQLNFGRDVQGMNAFAPQQSNLLYSASLAANTATPLTVPTSNAKFIAAFSYKPSAEVWVSINGTASAPAGGSFAVATSELNPSPRTVYSGDIISFFTTGSSVSVEVAFYVTT